MAIENLEAQIAVSPLANLKERFLKEQQNIKELEFSQEDEVFGKRIQALFEKMYDQAERTRRWNLGQFDWEKVARQPLNKDLSLMIDTFKRIEDFIPDFAQYGLGFYRRNLGLSNAHINWSAEEQRHGFALGYLLQYSGSQTPQELLDIRMEIFKKEWVPHFPTARQNIIYAAFQEQETRINYQQLANVAEGEGCTEAVRTLGLIARDEGAHHAFYREVVRMYLGTDEVGTAKDIVLVSDNFIMPAQFLLTDSGIDLARRVKTMERHGVFSKEQQEKECIERVITDGFKFASLEELRSVAA